VTTDWRGWSDALTARVAGAVRTRRAALGLTAAELSDRTVVGKPLTRAVISDLETGRKKSLEIVELLTLAAALDIPPVLLLFPGYPDGEIEVLPGRMLDSEDAALWMAGEIGLPEEDDGGSRGVELVRAVGELRHRRLEERLEVLRQAEAGDAETAKVLKLHEREIFYLQQRIEGARADLWGGDA